MTRFMAFWLALLLAGPVASHKASTAYLQMRLDGAELKGRIDIALRDLDYALGLDSDNDTRLTWGEVRSQQARIGAYVLDRLILRADDAPCALAVGDLLIADHSDGRYASLILQGRCGPTAIRLDVDYRLLFDVDALHRGLLNLEFGGSHAGMFSPGQRMLHFLSADAGRWQVFAQYLRGGISHVWTGWDHMLFLAGLFLPAVLRRQAGVWLPAPSLRPALTDAAILVTAFTLAHALTLSLAAIGLFAPPTRWVESGVAASVMFAGFNNLIPLAYRRLAWLAAGFGLVHGAAMSGALLELGLPPVGRVWALLAFNLGVEAAQLTVLGVVLPWAFVFRSAAWYRRWVMIPASVAITVVGLIWLIQRAANLDLGLVPG